MEGLDLLNGDSYKLVINKILSMVERGILKPDGKIYSENQLARILKISRSQVREVYSALNILGILHGEQGKGTFLCSNLSQENIQILYLMTLMEDSSLEDVVEIRRVLEIGALKLAIKNCTEKDLRILREYAQVTVKSKNYIELSEADEKFHYTILDLTNNSLLKYNYRIVRSYIYRLTINHWRYIVENDQVNRKNEFSDQHMNIVDAIEDKDVDRACNLMDEHLKNLMVNIIDNNINLKVK